MAKRRFRIEGGNYGGELVLGEVSPAFASHYAESQDHVVEAVLEADQMGWGSDDEPEDNDVCDENHNVIDFRENTLDVEEKEKCEIIESIIEDILVDSFKIINSTSPKTVTSLYGKVYVLKPSIKSL